MKTTNESNSKIVQWLVRTIVFIVAVVLLAYFFPQQGEKSFVFQEGRPWAYSLLTAPFDIPIYKDEARLAYERDSLMNDVRPIFYKDNTITTDMLNGFESELNALSEATLSNKDKKKKCT